MAFSRVFKPNIFQKGLGLAGTDADTAGMSFYVWVYCIICWFVQDALKVYFVRFLGEHNIFGEQDGITCNVTLWR